MMNKLIKNDKEKFCPHKPTTVRKVPWLSQLAWYKLDRDLKQSYKNYQILLRCRRWKGMAWPHKFDKLAYAML